MTGSEHPIKRRDFLKLISGMLGVGGLSFLAGFNSRPDRQAPVSQADYVDGISPLPVPLAPYLQQQVRMAAFLLPVDSQAAALTVDRYLNIPAAGAFHFQAIAGSLVMTYSEMTISSLDDRDAALGSFAETEAAFWLPVLVSQRVNGVYVPQRIAWFLPSLFVDEPYAIISGREVYGFNKQWGQFEKPAEITNPEFNLSVMGMRTFDRSKTGMAEPLMRVTRIAGESGQTSAVNWTDWKAASSDLQSTLMQQPGTAVEGNLLGLLTRMFIEPTPLIFLKQFRDAADPRKACYSALIDAPIEVNNFRQGGFLRDAYYIQVNPLASHPLCESLGLAKDGQIAAAAAWLELDFSLGLGRELLRLG